MTMKNPPHPGLTVRHDCLEPLGLTVTEGAKVLGVTRQALNNLVNGKSGISPEMAIRLSKAFGSSPETWLCSLIMILLKRDGARTGFQLSGCNRRTINPMSFRQGQGFEKRRPETPDHARN